jgi:hypothetical protein
MGVGEAIARRELCRIIRHLGSRKQIDAAMIFTRADFVSVRYRRATAPINRSHSSKLPRKPSSHAVLKLNQASSRGAFRSLYLERFSLFRDVLPERVGQIGRDVVPRFGGESIEKGPVFITDPAPREPPDRAIGRVAEQAPQDGTVGRPALGIQHAQMKLKEAVFVAPEHRGHVTVQDEAILIGQSFAVGGARYDVANPGIAQAREEFDVARASSLLH